MPDKFADDLLAACGTFRDLPHLPKRQLAPPYVKLGATIRAVRQELDLSMGDVARFLRCSVARLSDLERGEETDPNAEWCSCREGTWRQCKRCGGKGWVSKKESSHA